MQHHLTHQMIDLLGCIGFAALGVFVMLSWFALRRTIRQMNRLS